MNWQNQHLQNVEDEGFNSFDRTHIHAWRNIWEQGGHIGTVGTDLGWAVGWARL